MINLIKGRELLSTVVDDITNKLHEKAEQNLELPRMIYCYADSALIKALLSNPKLGVSSFTYKLNDFDVTLYFVPCDYLPFGVVDYGFF